MKIWRRLSFWNNPAVSNYPGHLVKKTGVRTLTVLHNHDNRESPFHRETRSKSWPWQKALVPIPYHLTQSSMGAGTLNLGDSVFLYTGNHCYMAIHWSLTPLFEVDYIDRLGTKESNKRTIPQRTPFRTILCLNHETLICTYVHSIINGSWVIACIRFYWTKFRVTVVYVIRITFILCST